MTYRDTRQYILTFFLLLLGLFANAQEFEKINTGVVGDIKYSILNPEQFAMVNGKGWVLLDGKKLDAQSDLYKLLHETGYSNVIPDNKLPNGDGVFIRGVDTNDEDNYGDTEKNRVVGNYQEDLVGPHNHNIGRSKLGDYEPPNDVYILQQNSTDYQSTAKMNTSETRPRNVCLYIYIKINQ